MSWSFTTTNSISIWGDAATPAITSVNDSSAWSSASSSRRASPGYVTGIQFYKGAGNTGHPRRLPLDEHGKMLASATFTNETATGWQQVSFATPVAIAANTVYVASYYAPNGDYSVNSGYFASSGVTSGPLTALSNATGNGNGVYLYGTGGGFPTSSYNATNYWVDVDFNAGQREHPAADSDGPDAGPGRHGRLDDRPVSVTFSEAIQPGTVSFTLTDPSGNSVAGVVTYNATTNTASVHPQRPAGHVDQYTATISGATDYFGNTPAAPASWSFTTAATATDTIWSNAATPAIPPSSDTAAVESWA